MKSWILRVSCRDPKYSWVYEHSKNWDLFLSILSVHFQIFQAQEVYDNSLSLVKGTFSAAVLGKHYTFYSWMLQIV